MNVTALMTMQQTNGKSHIDNQTRPIVLTTGEQQTIVSARSESSK